MDFNQLSVGDILTRMENMLGCYLTCQTKYRLLQCILEAEKDDITDDLGNKIESEFKFGNPTAKLKAQAIGYFRHTFEEIISNVKSTLTKTLINE